jgi:glycosyltransferase involved in cell wall biosynthesis
MKYRFHVLGIPHTVTTPEYSSCAFTQKVVKLCKMLRARGHHVIHYGHEDSVVDCSEHVTVTTRRDLEKAYPGHDWRKDSFPKYSMSDWAHTTFRGNAITALLHRKHPNDFLLCSFGALRPIAEAHPDMLVCESGIGYPDGYFAPFKVFESYAILHAFYGLPAVARSTNDNWYNAVIPNYFELSQFEYSSVKEDYLLFLGRVSTAKGVHIAIQIAEATGMRLVIAGAGEVTPEMRRTPRPLDSYVEMRGVVGPDERKQLLTKARALVAPSTFLEPFCGTQVEAMLSGTPVISTDWGAFAEVNVHGVTGYRCRTFEQFTWAARNIHRISPANCRQWSEANYSMERIGDLYEEYFESVMNIRTGRGWYQDKPERDSLDWLVKTYPNDTSL